MLRIERRSPMARAIFIALVAASAITEIAVAQPADGAGRGRHGRGPGPGGAAECEHAAMMQEGAGHQADMRLIHELFADRSIRRTVREIEGGVETITESSTPEGPARIQRHVRAMHERLLQSRPIHACDELFFEIFAHASAITMIIEDTPRGVKVRETSSDPYVTKLIRAHAALVSKFIENGMLEMRANHPAPPR